MMRGGLCKGLRKNLRHWFESRGDGTLPDFLVIGCMRCGTTAMTEALARHSQLVLIRGGRGNFFVNDEKYSRGIDWYKQGFPSIKECQRTEKALGRPCLTYETTPGYIFFQVAVERIAATLSGVRCIALLRNPVDSIWSHYTRNVSLCTERSHDDLMSILQEDLRECSIKGLPRSSSSPTFGGLLGRRFYGKQVKRWHEYMGRDNLLLLRSEDFYLNPQQALDEVQEFLGIKREILPVEKVNSSPYVEEREAPPQVADWIREVLAEDMQLLESVTGRQWNWW